MERWTRQDSSLKSRYCFTRDVDFEVVVVDDNSPDGTQEVVKQLQAHYGEDKIVSHTCSGSLFFVGPPSQALLYSGPSFRHRSLISSIVPLC
jgi:glycosyltransferase involved in cell wall biosynthesis